MTRAWTEAVVEPLRAARRHLATSPVGFDDGGRLALRAQVRGAELAAERLLVDALDGLTDAAVDGTADGAIDLRRAVEALLAATAAWGDPAPVERLEALARAAGLDA